MDKVGLVLSTRCGQPPPDAPQSAMQRYRPVR